MNLPDPFSKFYLKHKKATLAGTVVALLAALFLLFNLAIGTVQAFIGNVGFVSTTTMWVTSVIRGLDQVKPNDIASQQINTINELKECIFKESEWSGGFGSLKREDSANLYSVDPDSISSLIRYNRSVSSKSTTKFIFTPETELINTVVLFHDFFEIVIGDGDQYGVTFKANLGNKKMEDLGSRVILRGGIRIGNDVLVSISQQPLPRGDDEIIVSITYTSKEGNEESLVVPLYFPIPSEFRGTDKPIRISVGLVNTQDEQPISSRFKCFKVSTIENEDSQVISLER